MDRRDNPYTPNAGARPPVLVGREEEIESYDVLLARLSAGRSEQSLIAVGLRGVGKTVLLGEFRTIAEERQWQAIEIEVDKWDDRQFRQAFARQTREALHGIAPREKWTDRVKRAAGLLRSFTVSIDPDGKLTAGLSDSMIEAHADSGMLDADLTDLLVGVGEAASDQDTGVVLLLDELHCLDRRQLGALISALHKAVQRALPIAVAAAALPQIHELVGEAKTYAERLFRFSRIGNLREEDAARALREPAARQGVNFNETAVQVAIDFTDRYPYFLQEFGEAAWNMATGKDITGRDAENARKIVEEKMDSGFFKVRLDRTTELQRMYLRAMAELGPDPQPASKVAELLNRTSQQCGGTRKQLIDKGLLYTPDYGYAAFTVPLFHNYLKRAIPEFEAPPVRRRQAKAP